ncbi:alpha/beta hydrolase [Symbioplanes lichenis]|uniref:alpha/beta hydrolase n=1 Tax=Symbioplanes lichenis TaxID=1629072 RepID=UPI00273A48EC|nr:alpha/beta hydrolase [Actinoplanes lichenis]
MSPLAKRLLTAGVAGLMSLGCLAAPASSAPPVSSSPGSEAAKLDRVPVPKLDWYKCYDVAQCAVTRLPLDYDEPTGATTEVAMLRMPATDPAKRIGTLFVNPGGPGGAATDMAIAAPAFLSAAVRERFDILGVDPRGVGASEHVECWRSTQAQTAVLADLNVTVPWGRDQESAYVAAAKKVGRACSTTGRPLSAAMSTAEVVRDLEMVRRALGEGKLTFFGMSYGTVIGQYYAAMFPDRFRAIVADGVLDPVHWVGSPATSGREQDARLRSGNGAYRALRELLRRCDKAGEKYCVFAAGDPLANFERIAARLRTKPLTFSDPYGTFTITYGDFVGGVLGSLYGTDAGALVTALAKYVWDLMFPASPAATAGAKTALRQRATAAARDHLGRDFPYLNTTESLAAVLCTDAWHPRDVSMWPELMTAADKRAPYFGRVWGWLSAPCARDTWTVRDEDAYTGPFDVRTDAPVLFVGAKWDPATNHDDAVSASRRLPNGRLLSSDNWGHTSYGTSACVTGAVDAFLLTGKPPAKGLSCAGDMQPFTTPLMTTQPVATPASVTARPPVATPLPPSIFNGNR